MTCTIMFRSATYEDIADILDLLTQAPFLRRPLREDPQLPERLRYESELSVEKLGTPRSKIERSLRVRLRGMIGWS